ncbi:hypothetical protein ES708_12082 [subsurface metagenome]
MNLINKSPITSFTFESLDRFKAFCFMYNVDSRKEKLYLQPLHNIGFNRIIGIGV